MRESVTIACFHASLLLCAIAGGEIHDGVLRFDFTMIHSSYGLK